MHNVQKTSNRTQICGERWPIEKNLQSWKCQKYAEQCQHEKLGKDKEAKFIKEDVVKENRQGPWQNLRDS